MHDGRTARPIRQLQPGDAAEAVTPFSPTDMDYAAENFRAMCGHGALAAALGIRVQEAVRLFAKSGWINFPMMMNAIARSGNKWKHELTPTQLDKAVIQIQWTGPTISTHPRGSCKYRHWIAANRALFWDANFQRWMTQDEWKQLANEIAPAKATGYRVFGSLIIL